MIISTWLSLVHYNRLFDSLDTNKNAPHCCEAFGAENETRTRDPDLGKVVLYQLSYFRVGTTKVRTIFLFANFFRVFLLFRNLQP